MIITAIIVITILIDIYILLKSIYSNTKKPVTLYNEEKDHLEECIDIKEPRPIRPMKNTWLYPKDELGKMEQGIAWEGNYTSPIKCKKPEFINKDDIHDREVETKINEPKARKVTKSTFFIDEGDFGKMVEGIE